MSASLGNNLAAIPLLQHVAPLAHEAQAWIVDVWGVIHNGVRVFGPAADALVKFREGGGTVVLLTNAPRPAPPVMAQLEALGLPRAAYDAVVTSGDLTQRLLKAADGALIYHLGPERDLPLFDGLNLKFAPREEADLVLTTGLFDDTVETPDHYTDRLRGLAARRVPMICANPDLKVERGTAIIYCAGAIAELYESLGGRVTYAGKPHLPVYDLVFETIAKIRGHAVARDQMLAIGDGLRTDMLGAARAHIRSVFIASGIHVTGALDAGKLQQLFAGADVRPIAAMPELAW